MNKSPLSVNLEGLQAQILAALPHSQDRTRILSGLADGATKKWKGLARQGLRSTRQDYVKGIQQRPKGQNVVIELLGDMPNMVEQGISAFDLRETLLKGPNVKYGKDGQPYNTVPFRHGTPGTGGSNVGTPMPKPIYGAAAGLKATLSRPGKPVSTQGGKTVVYGERLHAGMSLKESARKILQKKAKPWHATSIYTGMIRKGKHIGGGKIQTTGYLTFRRISRKVRTDPNDPGTKKHWMHPGIRARNYAAQVQTYLGKIAGGIVKEATS